ncbi:hypothetical protein V1264_003131 [Littorina saxatilis]|uniref:MAM domain-containing protein n=1 Tax=Littorina saxatilis TaxID=31220 RepID=A0AAN9B5E0_9CAEN
MNDASPTFGEGQISYYTSSTYQITLDLLTNGGRGYVALDDFTFKPGMCRGKPDVADTGLAPTPSTAPVTNPPAGNSSSVWDCNFEQGLCSYTQPKDDQFDWTRAHGKTATANTGPAFDHTKGTDGGYYMYIETSNPQHANDTAHLASQPVNDGQPKCLTFWYHMFGPHVNTLNVYTKVGANYGRPIWTHQRSIDANWHQATVSLTNTHTYTIVFEGVRGTSWDGDIALDDIRVTDGACGASSLGLKCTFEDGNICGFTQSHNDKFDWTRYRRSTGSFGTGPNSDHTLGTASGYYMYTEASAPRHHGDKAQIISPSQPSTAGACLQFWYHMYGRQMGNLNVYLQQGGQITGTIFNISGNQGNRWIKAEMTVTSPSSSWEVVFEGIVGSGILSDIAIDDVSITSGACGASQGDCNFDKDTCTWSNVGGDDFDWLRGSGSTPSRYTGPSVDHTQGDTSGGYMFMESSAPRHTGDKIWLVSQPFPAFTSKTKCFNFWFHMYGAGIGTLNVYMDSTDNTTHMLLWSQHDSKGDNWLQGQMPLPPQSKEYQIRFEGVKGSSAYGDMALDDISFTSSSSCIYKPTTANVTQMVTPSPVPTPTPTAFVSNSPFDCAFEKNLCTWAQDRSDVFDWTRSQGPTGTTATGPTTDHTYGTANGWYMYMETSAPRKTNDTARLVSQQIQAQQAYCFTFWYHMYGAHVNQFNVYIRTGNNLGNPVWERQQSQGNTWIQGQVSVPAQPGATNLVFEGIRGPSFRGDIGLDDIRATPGICNNQATVACTFESGLCGWNQDKSDNFDWTSHTGTTSSAGTGPTSDHTLRTRAGQHDLRLQWNLPFMNPPI